MYLCILFPKETIPFELFSSEEMCLKAIEMARKQGWEFNERTSIIKDDLILLHACHKQSPKKKRIYILDEKVLLETDIGCPDEVFPTKELLAYENHCSVDDVKAVEI